MREIRAIDDTLREFQDIIERSQSNDPSVKKPTLEEMQQALLKSLNCVRALKYSRKFVAPAFDDDYVRGLEDFGIR